MPVLDGTETTRRLAERHPDVAVVVLTTYDDGQSVLAALRAGARSYLTKDARRPKSPRPCGPRRDLPDGLSQREAEILALIADGMVNPEIAAELFLSPHTVKSHISRIFAKTGSADRAAAIGYARQHGLG
jgi:DNA-binding NarL/FixJ family response regulator